MPILSRFHGIVVRMYFQQVEHNPPHIHALYGDDMVAIDVQTGDIMEGSFPSKQLSMLRQWVEINKAALVRMWETQDFESLAPLE